MFTPLQRRWNTFLEDDNSKVYMYVYDIGPIRDLPPNLIFHTSIVVYGKEFSYGVDGITISIQSGRNVNLYEKRYQGKTNKSLEETKTYVERLRYDWNHDVYELEKRNCHHFSQLLCIFLGVENIPRHYLDLAKELLEKCPKSLRSLIKNKSVSSGSRSTSSQADEKKSEASGCTLI